MKTLNAYSNQITDLWTPPIDEHFVYFADVFFDHHNYIKIGMTNNVQKRMANFNYPPFSYPELLFCVKTDNRIHAQSLEKYFHEKFKSSHARRECFSKTPELMTFIRGVINGEN